jgi:glycogen operon protein
MTASDDVFDRASRPPRASVNYVTAHDGFTLMDLVSFENKHNEKNLEGNHDGENQNDSTNCGVEGPTDDPRVLAERLLLRKNLLATLLLAHGVPMLLAGDEAGNSQGGNNNAYCQDNETGWVDWTGLGGNADLTDFIGQVTALRKRFPQLRAHSWLEGERPDDTFDVRWLTPQASDMTEQDWNFPDGRFLSYFLDGQTRLYVVLNGASQAIAFKLPDAPGLESWTLCLNTSARAFAETEIPEGTILEAPAQSVLVFSGNA